MSKFTGWFLAVALFLTMGVAVFELAYIFHLEFIIRLLAGGGPN